MKKILIITYYWPPAGGPGVQRWLKTVKYLPEFGWEPIILTVDPDFAVYPLLDDSLSEEVVSDMKIFKTKCSSSVYDLYKKLSPQKEVPYSAFVNEGEPNLFQKFSRFIRGNFFIPDSRKGWNKFALKKAFDLINKYNIETIITTSPPHSTQLIGLELKRVFNENLTWIADFRDPWTKIFFYDKMYPTQIARKKDLAMEKDVLNNSDLIITVSKSIKAEFIDLSGIIKTQKIFLMPNGFDEKDFDNVLVLNDNRFIINYIGTLPPHYKLDAIIQAVKIANNSNRKIYLRFVGKVDSIMTKLLKNALKDKVEFISYVPHNEAIIYMKNASALFHVINDIPENKGLVGGKLIEYIGSKRKIILIAPEGGEAERLVNNYNSGKVFRSTQQEQIAAYICSLYDEFIRGESLGNTNDNIFEISRRGIARQLVHFVDSSK